MSGLTEIIEDAMKAEKSGDSNAKLVYDRYGATDGPKLETQQARSLYDHVKRACEDYKFSVSGYLASSDICKARGAAGKAAALTDYLENRSVGVALFDDNFDNRITALGTCTKSVRDVLSEENTDRLCNVIHELKISPIVRQYGLLYVRPACDGKELMQGQIKRGIMALAEKQGFDKNQAQAIADVVGDSDCLRALAYRVIEGKGINTEPLGSEGLWG